MRAAIVPFISAGHDVVLLGHSYGGQVISEAAKDLGKAEDSNGIVHLIYCCAFMLEEGESCAGYLADNSDRSMKKSNWNAVSEDGLTSTVLVGQAISTFYADVDPNLAKLSESRLGTHSANTFASPLMHAGWKQIPSTYILCQDDMAMPVKLQKKMVERGRSHVKSVSLKASHSPFLSQPDAVCNIIRRATTTVA